MIPALAWLATALEVVLGIALLVGFKPWETGFASGVLLLLFALAMCVSIGIKAPLNYPVFFGQRGCILSIGFHPYEEAFPPGLSSSVVKSCDISGRRGCTLRRGTFPQ